MIHSTLIRVGTAIVFGVYFGIVVATTLVRTRQVPESVHMMANRRGSRLETEVRVNGIPIYVSGVEGMQ